MGRKRKADPNNDEAKVFKNQNELDKSNFADLPHEILLKIFSYLNLNTRCRIARYQSFKLINNDLFYLIVSVDHGTMQFMMKHYGTTLISIHILI